MPGALHAEYFEMSIEDALAILALDQALAELYASHDEVREIRRAAHDVVQAHGVDVIGRYASPAAPTLRVVKGTK